MRDVVVVGSGASGALGAARLADGGARVTLVDPSPAGGTAYLTADPRHLLNVPAGRMSALPDEPDDFVHWLRGKAGPADFVPRSWYGAYLRHHLETREVQQVRDEAVAAGPTGVTAAGGQHLAADDVVLALGNRPPSRAWVPAGLEVRDPWEPLDVEGDVLLVGTGLTAVDLALSLARPGRVVHLVSRHGWLPRRHAPSTPLPCPDLTGIRGLSALVDAVLAHLRADWRAGLDSLRPVTQQLWSGLSEAEKQQFVEQYGRLWDVHRHRMPPATADALDRHIESGTVEVTAAEVVGPGPALSDGRVLAVDAVVNCTGSDPDLRRSPTRLTEQLFREGLVRPGPLGWGFETDEHGRAGEHLWTLGPTRRGSLWETTAVPEIRCQARDLATAILGQPALSLAG